MRWRVAREVLRSMESRRGQAAAAPGKHARNATFDVSDMSAARLNPPQQALARTATFETRSPSIAARPTALNPPQRGQAPDARLSSMSSFDVGLAPMQFGAPAQSRDEAAQAYMTASGRA